MKILQKITLVFLLAAFISCSKDDDTTSERLFSNLSGTWEVTSYSYDGSTAYRAINTSETWNTTYRGEAWQLNFNFAFSENPNDYTIIGDYNVDHYFTDRNGQEIFYFGNLVKDVLGDYTRNSNTNLTLNDNGEYKQCIIHELSDTTLKFSLSESSSETNSDNVLVSKIRNEIYTLKRIN